MNYRRLGDTSSDRNQYQGPKMLITYTRSCYVMTLLLALCSCLLSVTAIPTVIEIFGETPEVTFPGNPKSSKELEPKDINIKSMLESSAELDFHEDVSNNKDQVLATDDALVDQLFNLGDVAGPTKVGIHSRSDRLNDRPVIGVLCQELDEAIEQHLPRGHNYTSYLAASYVKWVEAGGARAVPVFIGKDRSYYKKIFDMINGLLLPGGSAPLVGPGGFAEAGQIMFDLAKEANDRGDYFPVWGTCNGFELLTVMSMKDDKSRLTDCYSEDQALALTLMGDWRNSRIYGEIPNHILRDLTTSPVTINFHHFCLTPTNFTRFKIHTFWNALSINQDSNGLTYISTIEAKNYPFIGVQFHPEKNAFEWSSREANIPHSTEAINVSNYLGRFFVKLARNSQHSIESKKDEDEFLIYRYGPMYTGGEQVDMTFEQAYFF